MKILNSFPMYVYSCDSMKARSRDNKAVFKYMLESYTTAKCYQVSYVACDRFAKGEKVLVSGRVLNITDHGSIYFDGITIKIISDPAYQDEDYVD